MIRAVKFRVVGRVQGVGFREFTRWTAERLNLAGWVRNDPDGSVSGMAEGSPAEVARLLEALRRGPPSSAVSDLAVIEATAEGATGFRIARSP